VQNNLGFGNVRTGHPQRKSRHLKLRFGILGVTNISLIEWLVVNYETAKPLFLYADILAIVLISGVIFAMHKRINKNIEKMRDL